MNDSTDLFGNETPPPGLRPERPATQLELIDAAAERAALASGRPKSQERIEILYPET
jgi:hypothetical protein